MFDFSPQLLLVAGLVYGALTTIVLLLAVAMVRAGKLEDERMSETHSQPPDGLR